MTGTAFEALTPDWLRVGEARRRILEAAEEPVAIEETPLLEAIGRALAGDVAARADLPARANSAMDGYAVHAADVVGASPERPVTLRVVGRIRAGQPPPAPPGRGEAVRIMTGAPVPAGADSVVRVEDTDAEAEPERVRVFGDRDVRRHIRPAGEDARAGDRILRAGHAVAPGTVALLASQGRTHVAVHARPEVAILATGDELRGPERFEDVLAGQGVPESNRPMLAAATREAGSVPRLLPTTRDSVEGIQSGVRAAADADVLVTVGGASMGEADLVKRALHGLGFRLGFWRVKMRPGGPFSFGMLPRPSRRPQPVFGLPGNPASAFVTFELFVRPFLLRLAGHRRIFRRTITAAAATELRGTGGFHVFLRVRLDDSGPAPKAVPCGPQGSGLVRSLADADGLAVVPPAGSVSRGGSVDVMLLRGGSGPDAPLDWRGETG